MIRKFKEILPRPRLLIRLFGLQAAMALLQGALIGLLLPIFHALLRPMPDLEAALPWLFTGGIALTLYLVLICISTSTAFSASMDATAQIRQRVMDHTATLSPGWFHADNQMRLVRGVTSDSAAIGSLSVTFGAQIALETLSGAVLAVFALFIDWQAALPLVMGIPILIPCLITEGRRLSYIEEGLAASARVIAGNAVEFGRAQPVLRAAGKNNRAGRQMRAAIDQHQKLFHQGLDRSVPSHLGCMAIPIGAFIITLVLGVSRLSNNALSLADAIVLLIIAVRYVESLGSVVENSSVLGAISNSLGRVQGILRIPALPTRNDPLTVMENTEIEFCDVSFSYHSDANPVLQGVSFTCPMGSTTALVGASGTGKTTVTKLIARFFDVDGGSIRIGKADVRDYHHPSLLKSIAIIFQDVYLFDGTIEENLRLARPDATKEDLEEAIHLARLQEVIDRLPHGLQTQVGESGAMLSGGERQRVSIARAFLKNAPVVLIDEPVSALDAQNERAICEAIAALAENPMRTVVIIAHHPAILKVCDHVVALKDGKIAETGPPLKLCQTGGIFARLYEGG